MVIDGTSFDDNPSRNDVCQFYYHRTSYSSYYERLLNERLDHLELRLNRLKSARQKVYGPRVKVSSSTTPPQVENASVEETPAPVVSYYEVETTPVLPPTEQPTPSYSSSSHASPEQPRPKSIVPCLPSQPPRSIASNVENISNDKSPVSPCQRPAPVKHQSGLRELLLPKLVTSPSEEVLYNFKKRNHEEVCKLKTLGIFGKRPQSQFNDFHCQLPSATVDSPKSSSTAASTSQ